MYLAQSELSVDIDKDGEFNFYFVQVYIVITQKVHFQKDFLYHA